MKIACLTFNPIQENTYVVWDDTKECAVIDAGNSTPKEDAALDGFLAEHGLKPVLAVNTHGHFDHVLGVEHLRKTYGIPFALSGKDAFMLDTDAVGSTVYGVKINAMPTIDIDLDKVEEVKFGHTSARRATRRATYRSTNPNRRASSRAIPSSAKASDARICRAATIRGSCVRSWTTCSRWATKCASIPDTALKPPSATKCSTIPSSPKSSTRR